METKFFTSYREFSSWLKKTSNQIEKIISISHSTYVKSYVTLPETTVLVVYKERPQE